MFTIYYADVIWNQSNCIYPHAAEVTDEQSLLGAVSRDYVCAEYRNSRRSGGSFLGADCLPVDCDNDHSDNPADWITPEKVAEAFPEVSFAVHFSRHHMAVKGVMSARPRFHVLFAIDRVENADAYTGMKRQVNRVFPYFDSKALDAARFFYGTKDPKVRIFHGSRTLTSFLEGQQEEFDAGMAPGTYGREIIKEGSRNEQMSRFAGKIIKKYGPTKETWKLFLEEAARCDPPLPDEELRTIWRSAVSFGKKISQQEGYVPPEEFNREPEWEAPIPFDEYDLPPFPVDALPGPIADYVTALAESTQTPADMAATCAIAILSVCMQGKYRIRAKPDWVEPVNTFILDVMSPSERKSAVANAMMRPLNLYEAEQNRQNAARIEASRMQRSILEKRQRAVEDKVARGNAPEEEVGQIAEEIAAFREVRPLKLYVDDITTEKLTSVLAENNGRAAILSTEGGIFDTLAGAYSRTVNIDVMLKGYSGDSIRVDRIGRSSESILSPALTVLLMVQPSVLSGLMQNPTFRGRGLTARFLYCIPSSSLGSRRYRSASVPESVYSAYERRIRNLLEDECGAEPEIITLSPEADAMIEAFAEELEPRLVREYAEIVDWAGKLVGNVIRISALLCRAGRFRSHEFLAEPEPLEVSAEEMTQAIRIGRYFLEHAKGAFVLMGADPLVRQCKKVIGTIRDNGLAEFTRRDIMRTCRTLKTADEVQQVLGRLLDYGYIAGKEPAAYSGKGRRPGQTYIVNPHVFE